MAVTVSQIVVLVAGISLCVFASWGIYAPQRLLQSVKGMMGADWGIYFAIIVRLILGVALIITAPGSRFEFLGTWRLKLENAYRSGFNLSYR